MGMRDWSPGSVWYYAPNKAAPIVFIILFSISGALHAWKRMQVFLLRTKTPPEIEFHVFG
ncbi:hypothetical protein EJ02DRAFT_452010 [Clathrospora elynae]|uniref:Uncharacterized protein n=1 Tax=Clathrospora elynae TaxID=706981 RepID=A0A6A5SWR4_9PLEO|nr:hypothetical protein EJ02DRAFT_452010 [Clathrospora elynae]